MHSPVQDPNAALDGEELAEGGVDVDGVPLDGAPLDDVDGEPMGGASTTPLVASAALGLLGGYSDDEDEGDIDGAPCTQGQRVVGGGGCGNGSTIT